jgi:hypothetical protein
VDTTVATVSLTKIFNSQLTLLTQYTNVNTGDFFGAAQSAEFPPNASYFNFYTGQTVLVSPGFRGFGTTRGLVEQLVYNPNKALTLNVSMHENHDFPRPVAGPLELLGDTVGFVNFGSSPYEADLDLRYRINSVLVLDIARSYYFNFGGYERWAPQFSFQIEK